MAISKRLRFEILRRDNHTCRYCGASAPAVKLTVDHVVPEVLGGATEPSNLVTACEPCNSGKTSMPPDAPLVDDVKQDAIRWARAMEMARRGDQCDRLERDDRRETFLEVWNRWTYKQGLKEQPFDLPNEWPATVDALYRAGLDDEDLYEAVDVAMRRRGVTDRFKYFCGVCWTMVRSRVETAQTLAPLIDQIDALPPAGDSGDPWDF